MGNKQGWTGKMYSQVRAGNSSGPGCTKHLGKNVSWGEIWGGERGGTMCMLGKTVPGIGNSQGEGASSLEGPGDLQMLEGGDGEGWQSGAEMREESKAMEGFEGQDEEFVQVQENTGWFLEAEIDMRGTKWDKRGKTRTKVAIIKVGDQNMAQGFRQNSWEEGLLPSGVVKEDNSRMWQQWLWRFDKQLRTTLSVLPKRSLFSKKQTRGISEQFDIFSSSVLGKGLCQTSFLRAF